MNTAGEERRRRDVTSRDLGKEEEAYTCMLFGTNSLKEGSMWRICTMQGLLRHRNSRC
jgi:hypothetical protein